MFELALAWVLRPDVEGGEANHPADRGGHTKYGIADAADGNKDGMADLDRDGQPDIAIADLTPAHARPFYHANYWLPARCNAVEDVCPLIALALFDGAVHHGPNRSVRLLQGALGVLSDGVLGSQTLRVLSAKTRHDGGRSLLLLLLERRASFMLGIVRKDPSQWANASGWINRLLRLQSHLLSLSFGKVAP